MLRYDKAAVMDSGMTKRQLERRRLWKRIKRDKYQYLMFSFAFFAVLIFAYVPMFGVIMAFQDFDIFDGFLHSEWVGLENFKKIFTQERFLGAVWNTLWVSILNLLINFPAPIILALLINELEGKWFKKITQTVSYLPHFLSWISVIGIINVLFGRDGLLNDALLAIGAIEERITFLAQQENFIWFIIGSTLWKETGWGTVIHLANLSSISPDLYEAASIDGATRMQKIRYITLPHMVPTVMILLIFKMGSLFASNFELIYGLQNPYIDFEVISTVVYQTGIKGGGYSMATAVSLSEGLIALFLVLVANKISKKVSGAGLL